MFGTRVPYLFAIAANAELDSHVRGELTRLAANEQRIVIATAQMPGSDVLAWKDFCSALGGPVPTWRALSPNFSDVLIESAKNKRPLGTNSEAWLTFEDSICDGLEYLFGFRVGRYGGRTRGKKVSDMVATLPEQKLLIVDAKATSGAFDAAGGGLRALAEYVRVQKSRQQGEIPVAGSLVVSSAFRQSGEALGRIQGDFLAETGSPVTFCAADILAEIIRKLSRNPTARIAVRWSRLFCRGGLVERRTADSEINDAAAQRIGRK